MDSIKDVVLCSVKVPEFDKHLKKVGRHIGRNSKEEDSKRLISWVEKNEQTCLFSVIFKFIILINHTGPLWVFHRFTLNGEKSLHFIKSQYRDPTPHQITLSALEFWTSASFARRKTNIYSPQIQLSSYFRTRSAFDPFMSIKNTHIYAPADSTGDERLMVVELCHNI